MTQSGRGHSSSSRNLDSFLLKVGLLVAVAAFTLASAEATPARDSGLNRWLTRSVPDESDRIVQADVGSDDQVPNGASLGRFSLKLYLDANHTNQFRACQFTGTYWHKSRSFCSGKN